eukprot:641667-Pelagomonas_calceolata.AAC.3
MDLAIAEWQGGSSSPEASTQAAQGQQQQQQQQVQDDHADLVRIAPRLLHHRIHPNLQPCPTAERPDGCSSPEAFIQAVQDNNTICLISRVVDAPLVCPRPSLKNWQDSKKGGGSPGKKLSKTNHGVI